MPKQMENKGYAKGTCYWLDHVFVERRWRSVTYEEGSLHADDRVSEAQKWLDDTARDNLTRSWTTPLQMRSICEHMPALPKSA